VAQVMQPDFSESQSLQDAGMNLSAMIDIDSRFA
jgi:hypothetical protein